MNKQKSIELREFGVITHDLNKKVVYVKSLEIRSHYKYPAIEYTVLGTEAMRLPTNGKAVALAQLIGEGVVIEFND